MKNSVLVFSLLFCSNFIYSQNTDEKCSFMLYVNSLYGIEHSHDTIIIEHPQIIEFVYANGCFKELSSNSYLLNDSNLIISGFYYWDTVPIITKTPCIGVDGDPVECDLLFYNLLQDGIWSFFDDKKNLIRRELWDKGILLNTDSNNPAGAH